MTGESAARLPHRSAPPRSLGSLRSIRARLTITFTLLIALLLGSADVVLLLYSRRGASYHADRALREAADATHKAVADAEDEAREATGENRAGQAAFDLPSAVLQDLRRSLAEEQMAVLLIDNEGREWHAGDARSEPVWTSQGRYDGWRVRPVPLPVAPGSIGGIPSLRAAFVAYPWWREQAELRERMLSLAALSLFAVLATAVGSWVLVGGTLRPIDQLARQAASAAAPRAGRRSLVSPSPDVEVVRLVETLNRLIGSVGESADARGRFYAAASHELRTPLHVLAGQVELTLSRSRTSEEYRSALGEVGEQANRLTGLVESLLLLNRLEREPNTVDGVAATVAELVAACRRTLREQTEAISERELAVSLHIGDFAAGQNVSGELAHAEILLRNLVDNAVRYTPVGGVVRLRLYAPGGGGLGFDCENDAPHDLSARVTARLGEPFFRPDASRTTATGGNGLGLAICRALAEKNGWTLDLQSEHSVLRARVGFPEADA